MSEKAVAGNGILARASRTDWAAMAAIVGLVFLTYAITLTSRFGMLDDYAFLQNGMTGSKATLELLVSAGRPLNGWLYHVGFAAAGSIENLAVLRLITLVGIALLGCALYAFSRLHGLTKTTSLAVAAGVVLLPSFQVYAAWAQHFTTPFAALCGLTAAYLLSPRFSGSGNPRPVTLLLATLFTTAALLTYQPSAMFFCTGILIAVLASPRPLQDWPVTRIICAGAVLAVALLVGLAALKIGQSLYPEDSARYGLFSDLTGKAAWFVQEPLWNALSLYSVPGNKTVVIVCVILLLCGVAAYVARHSKGAGAFGIALLVLSLLGAYFPNLATAENWASYRSIGTLAASIIASIGILVIEPILRRMQRTHGCDRKTAIPRAIALAAVVFALWIAIGAQATVANALVLPNVAELDNLASLLQTKGDSERVTKILVRPSTWKDSAALPFAYDEFGQQSSSKRYYAAAIVDIVRRSMNMFPAADISLATDDQLPGVSSDSESTLYVDFPRLATSGRFKSAHLHPLSAKGIVLDAINDANWTNGIWTNSADPKAHSFVYRRSQNRLALKEGDRVIFATSGERVVIRVQSLGDYRNVLVNGPRLVKGDGYPALVTIVK